MKISLLEILIWLLPLHWHIGNKINFRYSMLKQMIFGLAIVVVEFNHVITYEHENIYFKLVFNLISTLCILLNLELFLSGKATINFKKGEYL